MKLWQWFREQPLWIKILIGLCVPVALGLAIGVALELLDRGNRAPEPAPVTPPVAQPVDDVVTTHVAEIKEELKAEEVKTDEAKQKVDDAAGFAAVDDVLYGQRK